MTIQNTAPALLRSAMLFSLTRRAWGNRSQGDKGCITTTADKGKLNMTKRLLSCPELQAINDHLNSIYMWCLERSMQSSAVRKGIYFVKRDMIPEFEAKLLAAVTHLNNVLIPELVAAYPDAKESMKLPAENGGLGDLFVESDYPSVEELRDSFAIDWSWLALSVPEELPDEVRTREIAKLRESFEVAQEEVKYALRESFRQVVAHAVERLTPKVDGTPKVFRESTINFEEFFETFHAKSMVDDAELMALVDQARAIIHNIDIKQLRNQPRLQEQTAMEFAQVAKVMDTLIIDKPTRRFKLDYNS